MMLTPSRTERLLSSLHQWAEWAQADIRESHDLHGGLIYGQGNDAWGVQTHQKAIATLAVLTHVGRDYLETTLRLLRFNLASHISGPITCTDGTSWGHTWISVLGIERMMHALEDIWELIPNEDQRRVLEVLSSEAEWLLNEYEIVAGEVTNNKPESNIWNGALLHRVAMMIPNHPKAEAFRSKGNRFLLNGISVPEDKCSDQMIDSLRLGDAHVGANFFSSYSLNHHGYLNVGYMVICLSNIAMLHFLAKRAGIKPPESLYHHSKELWQLIKSCTFDDGRLWRIGGDTRVRYGYCQDYALPMWAWVQDDLGEDCSSWVDGWLDQVYKEQENTETGSYLGERLSTLRDVSPLYYNRLETDRSCSLSMLASWQKDLQSLPETSSATSTIPLSQWQDPYHGSLMNRGKKRWTSFTWLGGEGPTASCVAPEQSHMVEWGTNGLGRVQSLGYVPHYTLESHGHSTFQGGFVTGGVTHYQEEGFLPDSKAGVHSVAKIITVAIALPDDRRFLLLQRCFATQFNYFRSHMGLHWSIPNDVFNGYHRSYQSAEENWNPTPGTASESSPAPWWLVDHHWGVASLSSHQLTFQRKAERQAGIKAYTFKQHAAKAGGFLYLDTIGVSPKTHTPPKSFEPGDLLHQAFVMIDTQADSDTLDQIVSKSSHRQEEGADIFEVEDARGNGYRVTAHLHLQEDSGNGPDTSWISVFQQPHGMINSESKPSTRGPGSVWIEKL